VYVCRIYAYIWYNEQYSQKFLSKSGKDKTKLFHIPSKTKDLATKDCVANLSMRFSGYGPRAFLNTALLRDYQIKVD